MLIRIAINSLVLLILILAPITGPRLLSPLQANIASTALNTAFSTSRPADPNPPKAGSAINTLSGTSTRVSVASDGTQGNNMSMWSSISADGRFVAFDSQAGNLVGGDSNNTDDIFIHDNQTGMTERVSVASDGTQGNNYSVAPWISSNGRFVAFVSIAGNLVSGDSNNTDDIFVHDRQTGTTERVSVASDGTQGNRESEYPFISADGRYVAFVSAADNLVSGDNNDRSDVFVRDRQTGTTELVSVASDGTQGNDIPMYPSISADGRVVVFISYASNLVSSDTNNKPDIFMHDRQTGTTELVSVAPDGTQGNGASMWLSIAADGRFVAFSSMSSNLVGGDTNNNYDVFVYDRQIRTMERVSVASDGTQGNGGSWFPYISTDGRFVAFVSSASNLVSGDNNGEWDIFVHDRQTGTTERVSVASDGTQGNGSSGYYFGPSISANGRFVAFDSQATNIVPGDTNNQNDVFIRDRGWIYSLKPFLDLPVSYTTFEDAAMGNTGAKDSEARINSWFDHTNPGQTDQPPQLTRWNGTLGSSPVDVANCQHPIGNFNNCYDGHDGLDFRHSISGNETIKAAGSGNVVSVVKNCQSSPSGCLDFGNQIWIDHQNCFMTLYGHLQSIDPAIENATTQNPIPVTLGQPIGIMGSTGYSFGTHLHFGVYMDPNCDGKWADKVPVDPYNWLGFFPWKSLYSLWIHPLGGQNQADSNGGSVASPSGIYQVIVPPGALNDPVTLDLLVSPPISGPSTQLRSIGRSFWLQVLEWLTGEGTQSQASITVNHFNSPISVSINYSETLLNHLDENNLSIMQWDELSKSWLILTTTLDTHNHTANAQTTKAGYFDLQAPLKCPADSQEPDDNYDSSRTPPLNGSLISDLFDTKDDADWFRLDAINGWKYSIQTSNLAAGVDTKVEIYDQDGITVLASDDNSGGGLASELTWNASATGIYFIRVSQGLTSAFGCSATYDIRVKGESRLYLPTIVR